MRRRLCPQSVLIVSLFTVLSPGSALGQLSETASWAATLASQYRITPNITYLTANNWEARLDVYQPIKATTSPTPVLVYIHGGGWVGGDRNAALFHVVPYLEMGWAAVNVSYRLARVSLAPAAVEDCRCALRWVISKAKDFNFDVNKLVVTGHSAGGHLSLMTGMLPASAGLDRQCPGNEELKVAAIINWYGITDVGDLLEGPNVKPYAVTWLSSLTNRDDIAKRVSPLSYVRPGLPPILTIHGDADPTVPYAHATRLHDALTKAGVPNQLLSIPEGKHGGFNREETLKIFATIQDFLTQHNLLARTTSTRN
jgi:acetyl esterase/lipase